MSGNNDNGKNTENGENTSHSLSRHSSHKVTIRDVAKVANVAPSTVSRAFSRPGRVSAETTKRIFDIANEIGYRTDSITPVSTSEHFTGLIGIVVADLSNPVFSELTRAVQHECFSHNLGVLVIDSEENIVVENDSIRMANQHIDGIILGSSRLSDTKIRKLAQFKPLVAINREIRGVHCIVADPTQGLEQAVDHLDELGHHSITYLSGPDNSWQNGMRYKTLSHLCSLKNITLHKVSAHAPTFTGGYRCREEFLANPSTAVVAYNDTMAIGFIAAMHASGIQIPQQVSVVGIDNVTFSSLVTPAISTISLPRKEVGKAAADAVISIIKDADEPARTLNFKSRFVARSSTGAAPEHRIRPVPLDY